MGYFERALLAAVVIGAASGLVGTIVVLRKRVFFAQALTHATFPGAVAAAVLGLSIPLGAALASVVIVGIMALISRVRRQGTQVAAGIVLTAGFALGVVLQALNPGVPMEIESFLVGSILSVSTADVVLGIGRAARHSSRAARLRQGARLPDLRPAGLTPPPATASGRWSCSPWC